MKIFTVKMTNLLVVLFFVLIQKSTSDERPCVKEIKEIYTKFYASLMQENGSANGRLLTIAIEKKYNRGKIEKDTLTYIVASNRIKVFSSHFTFESDGANYIVIVPAFKSIIIQKLAQKKQQAALNPIDMIHQLADIMISDKNFLRCEDIVDSKKIKYRNLVVQSPLTESSTLPIETMQFTANLDSRSLVSIAVGYKSPAELKEEKYTFLKFESDYAVPSDVLCPLEEVIYTKNTKLRSEYRGYTIDDMRKRPKISNYKFK